MPRVIGWISCESAERLDGVVNVGGWGGFMTEEMRRADWTVSSMSEAGAT